MNTTSTDRSFAALITEIAQSPELRLRWNQPYGLVGARHPRIEQSNRMRGHDAKQSDPAMVVGFN